MYGQTDRISPHSTGLSPLSGPLPCYVLRFHHIKQCLKCFCSMGRDEPATDLLRVYSLCYLYIHGAWTDIGEGSKRRESLEEVMQEAEMLEVLRGENRRKLEKGERYSETIGSC